MIFSCLIFDRAIGEFQFEVVKQKIQQQSPGRQQSVVAE